MLHKYQRVPCGADNNSVEVLIFRLLRQFCPNCRKWTFNKVLFSTPPPPPPLSFTRSIKSCHPAQSKVSANNFQLVCIDIYPPCVSHFSSNENQNHPKWRWQRSKLSRDKIFLGIEGFQTLTICLLINDKMLNDWLPGVAPQHPPQGPHPGSFEARVPRFSPETTSFQIHTLWNLVFWAEFSFPFPSIADRPYWARMDLKPLGQTF